MLAAALDAMWARTRGVSRSDALDPDTIVGEGYNGKGMDALMAEGVERRLQRIAPTVYIDVFRPVEEVMADFAELLGPRAQRRYDELRGEYEDALAGYRDRIADREGLSPERSSSTRPTR